MTTSQATTPRAVDQRGETTLLDPRRRQAIFAATCVALMAVMAFRGVASDDRIPRT